LQCGHRLEDEGDVDKASDVVAIIGDVGDNDLIVGCGESNLLDRTDRSSWSGWAGRAGNLNGARFSSTTTGDRVGEGFAFAELLTIG
jgi:hypothetical protein